MDTTNRQTMDQRIKQLFLEEQNRLRAQVKKYDPSADFRSPKLTAITGKVRKVPSFYKDKRLTKDIKAAKKVRASARAANKRNGTNHRLPSVAGKAYGAKNSLKYPPVLDHVLAQEPNRRLVEELHGLEEGDWDAEQEIINAMPQTQIFRPIIGLSLPNLQAVAFSYPALGLERYIEVGSTIQISGGSTVGYHYLVYLTIMYDLLSAANGQIPIISKAPALYWHLRSALTPRTIDGFGFAFDTSTIPAMADLLAAGVDFTNPLETGATLAWFSGGEDNNGVVDLVNTVPVVTIQDIQDYGISTLTEMWSSLMCEERSVLVDMPDTTPYTNSPAAFATPVDAGPAGLESYANYRSERFIREDHEWLCHLGLAVSSSRRGNTTKTGILGPCIWQYMLWTNTTSARKIRVVPKQIPVSGALLSVLTQITQADIINANVNLSMLGVINQPSDSKLLALSSFDILRTVLGALVKRYAASNFMSMATRNPNAEFISFTSGYRFAVGAAYDAVQLPMNVIEASAALSWFIEDVPYKDGYHYLYIPSLGMTGQETRVNTLENHGGGADDSITSLVQEMYPNNSPGVWSMGGSTLPATFDILEEGKALFLGSSPTRSRRSFSDVISILQGNFFIGPALSNVHDKHCTSMFLTGLCDNPAQNTWDDSSLIVMRSCSNKSEFDPNMITDMLLRWKPMLYCTIPQEQAYIALTDELKGIDYNTVVAAHEIVYVTAVVHPVAGEGNEQATMDEVKVEQGLGGGFLDVLKKIGSVGLPVLGQIGGAVLDNYMPGIGGIVGGLGQAAGQALASSSEHRLARKKVMAHAWRFPNAIAFRPITCTTRFA